MKIVKFLGGLGNQMFQYAFYLSLQKTFKSVKADITEFESYNRHNGFELNNVFNIRLNKASSIEVRIYGKGRADFVTRKMKRLFGTKFAYYEEKLDFGFDQQIFSDKKSRYLWGYWQNVNYFNGIEDRLREDFTFRNKLIDKNLEVKNILERENSVSLHVRRGDYINDPLLGNICTLEYYRTAINTINEKVSKPFFVIFSDDPSWCRDNFSSINPLFVDWNLKEQSYLDLQLMSICKHNIISNSSFSWWGSWLNQNPSKIIISPKVWANTSSNNFSGIILKNFITL